MGPKGCLFGIPLLVVNGLQSFEHALWNGVHAY